MTTADSAIRGVRGSTSMAAYPTNSADPERHWKGRLWGQNRKQLISNMSFRSAPKPVIAVVASELGISTFSGHSPALFNHLVGLGED